MPSKRLVYTALHQAILECRLQQVKLLLEKCDSNVDSKDIFGRTPLMLCTLLEDKRMRLKMLRLLLQAKPYMEDKDNLGRTVLAYACIYGREEIVQIFIGDQIVDSTEPDNDGNTPLHHTAVEGNWRTMAMLVDDCIENLGNMDAKNSLGFTPLMLACQYRNHKAALYLALTGGASGFLKDNIYFRSALEWLEKAESFEKRRKGTPQLSRSYTGGLKRPMFLTERMSTGVEPLPHFYRDLTSSSIREGFNCFPHVSHARTTLGFQDRNDFASLYGRRKSVEEVAELERSRTQSRFSKRSRATTNSTCVTQYSDESGRTIQVNVDLMSPASAKQLLVERLNHQAYQAAPYLGLKRTIVPNSRPQTSELRMLSPKLKRSEKENTCRLLGLYHASQTAPKSAFLIRQETGFSEFGKRMSVVEGHRDEGLTNRTTESEAHKPDSPGGNQRRVTFASSRSSKK